MGSEERAQEAAELAEEQRVLLAEWTEGWEPLSPALLGRARQSANQRGAESPLVRSLFFSTMMDMQRSAEQFGLVPTDDLIEEMFLRWYIHAYGMPS